MDPEVFLTISQIIVAVAVLIAGAVYVISKVRREERDELLDLAETRGQVNIDLRAEVESLRREVAELRGALEAVQRMKTEEMARRSAELTAERLLPFLVEHPRRGGES